MCQLSPFWPRILFGFRFLQSGIALFGIFLCVPFNKVQFQYGEELSHSKHVRDVQALNSLLAQTTEGTNSHLIRLRLMPSHTSIELCIQIVWWWFVLASHCCWLACCLKDLCFTLSASFHTDAARPTAPAADGVLPYWFIKQHDTVVWLFSMFFSGQMATTNALYVLSTTPLLLLLLLL